MTRNPEGGRGPAGGESGRSRISAAVRLAELDDLELRVEKLVAGGEGLARFEGIPIFVPRSAPGDHLLVRLVERRPDYGRAEILQVLRPGPGRREPPCPHFGVCGGCDLQHLDDDLQLKLKAQSAREALVRLGKVSPRVEMDVMAGSPWGYRLRTQLRAEPAAEGGRVGYYARGSRQIVPVRSCPVLVQPLENLLVELTRNPPAELPGRLDLAAGDEGTATSAPWVEGLPHGEITLSIGEYRYRFDARCFFQGHLGLLPKLVERVVGEWSGERAFDLFAGVGLFSLPLSSRYQQVVAVEADRVAARFARLNARDGRASNLEVVTRAVESWMKELPSSADRVLVDPPRSGLSRAVRRMLLARRPARLTYASCHPATLARDLQELAGPYDIEKITLLDLFPQTGHIETVAQLVLRDQGPVGRSRAG